MKTIFHLLPLSCTPELNAKQKDSLLKFKEYTIPGGDSVETVKYDFSMDEKNKYISYEYSFTTGQRAFDHYEIKTFTKTDGRTLVLFAKYGGMRKVSFFQDELTFFSYENNKLTRLKEKLLPKNISLKAYFKKNIPDSVYRKLESSMNTYYDLDPSIKNGIEFNIDPGFSYTAEFEKYYLGTSIRFTWNGNSFSRKLIKE